MFVFAAAVQQALPYVNLSGVILGFIGSLFLTYDLLGRPGGFLRGLLAALVPGILSAVIFVLWQLTAGNPLTALGRNIPLFNENIDFSTPNDAKLYLNLAAFGMLIGVLTGVFLASRPQQMATMPLLDATTATFFEMRARSFSWKNARRGGILGGALLIFANAIYVVTGNLLQIADVIQFIVFVLTAFLIGGYSQQLVVRVFPKSGTRVRLFSVSGLMYGMCISGILDLVFLYSYYLGNLLNYPDVLSNPVLPHYLWSLTIYALFDAGLFTMIPGGISGGLSRYIFWRANIMPDQQLGAFGLCLIIGAFLTQAFEPLAQIFHWM